MPGYPEGLLKNRSVVKHGNYAVITPEGRYWYRGGINPVLVDVTSKLALADAFVVVSAPTDRQVRAIAEDIMDRIWAEQQRRPAHIEGRGGGTWILIDYSDLVVHVMGQQDREYYALEKMWGDCPVTRLDDGAEAARREAAARSLAHAAVEGGA